MQTRQVIMLAVLMLTVYGLCTMGTAQEASSTGSDELSRAIHKQDLDSYWLDQNMWMEYGYRPHVKAHLTPFTSLPTYGQSTGAYSFGTDLRASSLADPYDKQNVQLTKHGTWH